MIHASRAPNRFREELLRFGEQPRDAHGRFAKGSGASAGKGGKVAKGYQPPSVEDQDKTAESLKGFLTMVATLQPPRQGMTSPQQLMLDHGQTFHATPRTQDGPKDPAHECYANAGRRALLGQGTYVEGYISVQGVPIEHAWLVDKQGRVKDPTIRGNDVDTYFGIPITNDYLRSTVMKTKVWGVLGGMYNRDLYESPVPSNFKAKVGD